MPDVVVLAAEPTMVEVANTTAETDLLNQTIPAGLAAPDRVVRTTLVGVTRNFSGTTDNPTVRIYIDGVVRYQDTPGMSSVDTWFAWSLTCWIGMVGPATAYLAGLIAGGTANLPVVGIGKFRQGQFSQDVIGSAAGDVFPLDPSASWGLRVTWQFAIASPQTLLRRQYAIVEVL